MWTKMVLLFGLLAFALLLLVQVLPLEFFYVLPVSARAPGSLFSGLAPALRFWVALLAIALVHDYVVSQSDRTVVRPFASALRPETPSEEDSVTQVSDGSILSTSTSGSVSGRMASVTFRDAAGSRTNRPTLRVDVSCSCSWTLDIRRNSLVARLLGRAGAVVATGDRELDALVVVQADDADAVRAWIREPAVRNRILSLFQEHKVDSISVRDGGSVLRAEFVAHNPFTAPKPDPTGVTEALGTLADTLEGR